MPVINAVLTLILTKLAGTDRKTKPGPVQKTGLEPPTALRYPVVNGGTAGRLNDGRGMHCGANFIRPEECPDANNN